MGGLVKYLLIIDREKQLLVPGTAVLKKRLKI
jgi:hypothetical protein